MRCSVRLVRGAFLALAAILAVLGVAQPVRAGSWVRTGPDGGTVPSVAFDAAGVAYAGTLNGVYVKRPGDSGWQFAGMTYPVYALAADPTVPGVVWAANPGVSRTSDGGATWQATNALALTIVVDPVQPATVYAMDDKNISKTIDGGMHWTTITLGGTLGRVQPLAIDPTDHNRLYVTVGGYGGVLVSPDGGTTWARFNGGGDWHTIDPFTYADSVIALADAVVVGAYEGMFRTTDGGANWQKVNDFRVNGVAQPTRDPHAALVGTLAGPLLTTDDGATWDVLEDFFAFAVARDPAHPDTLLAAGSGTLYRSTDRGKTWTQDVAGIAQVEMEKVIAHPSEPAAIFGVGKQHGLYESTDAGRSWTEAQTPAPPTSKIQALEVTPSSVFASIYPSVYRSEDLGASWTTSLDGHYALALAVAPSDPQIVYAATLDGVFRSVDGGTTWVGHPFEPQASHMRVDPNDPATVFLNTDQGLFKSADGGATFQTLPATPAVWAIELLGTTPPTLVTFLGGRGLVRSNNGGSAWWPVVFGDEHPLSITSVSAAPEKLYLGMSNGTVYESTDAVFWHTFLPRIDRPVDAIAVDPGARRTIYAAGGFGVSISQACDAAPRPECVDGAQVRRSRLVVDADGTAEDSLEWRWKGRLGRSWPGEHPTGTTYALCVYEGTDARLALNFGASASLACDGAPCWTTRARKLAWHSPADGGPGLSTLTLPAKKRARGTIAATVVGAALSLGPRSLPALPLEPPVVVQLQSAAGGCWGSTYNAEHIDRNDDRTLTAHRR